MTFINLFARWFVLPVAAAMALAALIGYLTAGGTVSIVAAVGLGGIVGSWGVIRFLKEYRDAWR